MAGLGLENPTSGGASELTSGREGFVELGCGAGPIGGRPGEGQGIAATRLLGGVEHSGLGQVDQVVVGDHHHVVWRIEMVGFDALGGTVGVVHSK